MIDLDRLLDLLVVILVVILVLLCLAPAAFAGLVILSQCIDWLKTGEWKSYQFAAGLEYAGFDHPKVGWAGVQKIIDWIFAWPLSVGLVATSFVFGHFAVAWGSFLVETRRTSFEAARRFREALSSSIEPERPHWPDSQ
ncbi:MAG: hypothetical protein J0I45_21490 [Bosea sp.]|nr:hypothetical protein [Bosea sp. (in: a-proteobacteria)]